MYSNEVRYKWWKYSVSVTSPFCCVIHVDRLFILHLKEKSYSHTPSMVQQSSFFITCACPDLVTHPDRCTGDSGIRKVWNWLGLQLKSHLTRFGECSNFILLGFSICWGSFGPGQMVCPVESDLVKKSCHLKYRWSLEDEEKVKGRRQLCFCFYHWDFSENNMLLRDESSGNTKRP